MADGAIFTLSFSANLTRVHPSTRQVPSPHEKAEWERTVAAAAAYARDQVLSKAQYVLLFVSASASD
jgi:hypothetical protein